MNWFPSPPRIFDNRQSSPTSESYLLHHRNYEEHAKEMGGEVDRKAPFHFQKSFDALTFGPNVRYPSHTDDLHHEVELVAVLGNGGSNLSLEEAQSIIFGYAVGLDFTRRDRQAEAKEKAVLGKLVKISMMLE